MDMVILHIILLMIMKTTITPQSYGDWDEEYEDYVEIDEDYDVSFT